MPEPFDDGLSVTRVLTRTWKRRNESHWRQVARVLLLLLLALACQQIARLDFPQLDERASVYFLEISQKAVVSYAMVRGANAAVSVVQNSELLFSPTGLGMSLAIGQVLDPLDDMLERTSDVLVMALVSIGVQRAVLEISQEDSLHLAAMGFLLAALAACFPAARGLQYWMLRLAIVFALLRLLLPASAAIFDQTYQRIFLPQIEQAQETLRLIPGVQPLMRSSLSDSPPGEQEEGWLRKWLPKAMQQQLDDAKGHLHWLKQTFSRMIEHASELIDALVRLISAYAAIFILQVVLLPLTSLWLLFLLSHWIAEQWSGYR